MELANKHSLLTRISVPFGEKRFIGLLRESRLNHVLGRISLGMEWWAAFGQWCLLSGWPDFLWALGLLVFARKLTSSVFLGKVIVVHWLAIPELWAFVFGRHAEEMIGVAQTALKFISFVLEIKATLFPLASFFNGGLVTSLEWLLKVLAGEYSLLILKPNGIFASRPKCWL
jgi:hypothetical protein